MKNFDEHEWELLCELHMQKWCEMSSTANCSLIANPMASTENATNTKEWLVEKQSGTRYQRLTLQHPQILMRHARGHCAAIQNPPLITYDRCATAVCLAGH
jgi:hypothetical protein